MLNELIQEYCKLTGRPVATITVSEYLEFYSAAQKPVMYTTEMFSERPEAHAQKREVQNDEEINEKTKADPISSKSNEPVPIHPVSKQTTSSKDMALKMLQAVSG